MHNWGSRLQRRNYENRQTSLLHDWTSREEKQARQDKLFLVKFFRQPEERQIEADGAK